MLDETTISLSDPPPDNEQHTRIAPNPPYYFDTISDVVRTLWEIRSRQPAVASSSNHVGSTLLFRLSQSPLERSSCLDSGNHVVYYCRLINLERKGWRPT